jgi:hypothetical protein
MPVLIHANGTDAQGFAVQAGADIIAHGLWHWNRDQQATQLTARAKTILDSALRATVQPGHARQPIAATTGSDANHPGL